MEHASEAVAAYEKHGPALIRKAERILLDTDDATDIVHGLFVDLMQRKRANLELPYLYRAVTNRCLNHLRDRDNRRRLLEKQAPALRGAARVRCDDQVIGADLLVKLRDRLDEACLEVLVCRFYDDMSQEETAALLGTSRKTVGKRLAKIRAAVAELTATGGGAS